jgi:exopolysaccharide production protein ExoQ
MSSPYRLRPCVMRVSSSASPVYQQVLSWVLLLPLLYLVTNGQPSIPSLYNGQLMTQNAVLLRPPQGIRPLVVLYVVFMVGFILIGCREIWRVIVVNKLIMAGILFAALSASWSEVPLMTLRVTCELTMTTLFAFYLSERFSTEHLMRLLMFVATIGAICSIVLIVFLPQYGIYLRDGDGGTPWQGICSHKNSFGVAMAFLLTPVFFVRSRVTLKIAYGGLLLFLIVMSQSRGAWFVTVGLFLFVTWLVIFKSLGRHESLLLIAVTTVSVILMFVLGLLYLDPLTRAIGKDPTLTGRTGIYMAVLESIFKHPVRGYGFGAFWLGFNPESWKIALRIHWLQIGYAENGFLELGLQLGAVGLLLVLLAFGRAISQGVRLVSHRYYNPRVGWFSAILFVELITNIIGGAVMTPVTLNWSLTLIAFVGLANEVRYQHGCGREPAKQRPERAVWFPRASGAELERGNP